MFERQQSFFYFTFVVIVCTGNFAARKKGLLAMFFDEQVWRDERDRANAACWMNVKTLLTSRPYYIPSNFLELTEDL